MKSAVCGLSPSWEASRHSPVALEKLLKDEQPPSVQKHRSQSLVGFCPKPTEGRDVAVGRFGNTARQPVPQHMLGTACAEPAKPILHPRGNK